MISHEKNADLADKPIQKIHFSAEKALLPILSDLFAVCDRGD